MCPRFELYVQVYNLNNRTEQNEEEQNENGERPMWKIMKSKSKEARCL